MNRPCCAAPRIAWLRAAAAGLAFALAHVCSFGAVAENSKGLDPKNDKTGFSETAPPDLEIGMGARDAAETPGGEVSTGPGQVTRAQAGGSSGEGPANQDIDIAEVGRLMDAQGGGRNAQPSGTSQAQSRPQDVNPLARALQGLFALVVVLALIILTSYLFRKFARRTPLLTALAGPNLGSVLGKIHLGRGVSLNYVQTGGRVLVIGVTPTTVSLVAEFDDSAFEQDKAGNAEPKEARNRPSFLEQLLASRMQNKPPASQPEDAGISQLRGDIERLQRHLQDLSSETRE